MKTAIVTDSNSGISQAEAEQLGISVLAHALHCGRGGVSRGQEPHDGPLL